MGRLTILMNDHPWFKVALISVLGYFVVTGELVGFSRTSATPVRRGVDRALLGTLDYSPPRIARILDVPSSTLGPTASLATPVRVPLKKSKAAASASASGRPRPRPKIDDSGRHSASRVSRESRESLEQ